MEAKDYFSLHEQDIKDDIKRLVLADSPSQNKELLDICKEVIQSKFFKYFHIKATEFAMEHNGNHLRFEIGEGTEQVLMIGHYDTVWDAGSLPYREEDDKIFGPGILDMKSGLVSAIWFFKYVQKMNFPLKRRVVFFLNSDEEIGSPTSRALIEEEAKKSVAAFVLEPAVAVSGELKIARKGTSRYLINIKGLASHAGNNPRDGVSAITEAARQILNIEALNDFEKGTTLNVGMVQGGGKLNVIPDEAHLGVDVRSVTKSEQERIDDYFEKLEPYNSRTQIDIDGGINRPPMERDKESEELFEIAQGEAEELGFEVEDAEVGGASDGNFTSVHTPTLDGLGLVGDGIHAEHEHIIKDKIVERFALLTNTLLEVVNE
ncbi:M20 family metallopeptidase [Solibacillus merdavium]|uniref:M20 family metallopeptidase n=1 Tax=Solibacillus merdavium TaxID=2762218 RepID=A0ABR8XLS2_9BACL|nr:M20 family metallopeptidase [Solibacillus merdavium]MBD8032892.1 M20 family metallopeptidase [Solibacillus merdavium]